MAITTTIVTGPVYLPNCQKASESKIVFELTSWDKEEGEAVFVTGPFVGEIDTNGEFSVELFTSTEGENQAVYNVSVIYLSVTGEFKREYIGKTALSGIGPYKLADLDFTDDMVAGSFDLLAAGAAHVVSAESAQALAQAAVAGISNNNIRYISEFSGDLYAATATGLKSIVLDMDGVYASQPVVVNGDFDMVSNGEIRTITPTGSFNGPFLTVGGKLTIKNVIFEGNNLVFTDGLGESGFIEPLNGIYAENVTIQNITGDEDHKIYGMKLDIGKNNTVKNCVFKNITTKSNSVTPAPTGGFCGGVFISNDIIGATTLEVATHLFEGNTFEDIYTLKNNADLLAPDSDGIRTYVYPGAADNDAVLRQTSLVVRDCKFINVLKSGVKGQDIRTFIEKCSVLVNDLKDQGQTFVELGFRAMVGHEVRMTDCTVVGNIKTAYAVGCEFNTIKDCMADLTYEEGSLAVATVGVVNTFAQTTIQNVHMLNGTYVVNASTGEVNISGITTTEDFGGNGVAFPASIIFGHRANIKATDIDVETLNTVNLFTPRNSTADINKLEISNARLKFPTSRFLTTSTGFGVVQHLKLENINYEGATDDYFLAFYNGKTYKGKNNTFIETGNSSRRLYDMFGSNLISVISENEVFETSAIARTLEDIYIRAEDTDGKVKIKGLKLKNTRGTQKTLADIRASKTVQLIDCNFENTVTPDADPLVRYLVCELKGTIGNKLESCVFDCANAAVYLSDASLYHISLNNSGTFNTTDNEPIRSSGTTLQSSGNFTY